MNSGINIPAVVIANAMGFVMLAILTLSNFWRLKEKTEENRHLHLLMHISFVACLMDPFAFIADGRAGTVAHWVIIIANSILYEANMISGVTWNRFLQTHINAPKNHLKIKLMYGLCALGAVLLLVNVFYPVVFVLDSHNVYSRTGFYWLYLVVNVSFVLDSIVTYLNTKRKGGLLKLFPLWVYLAPLIIGATIQTFFYGVSTIWPFTAIAVMGVMASMKNETIFVDHLTGMYNRFYLDYIQKEISKSSSGNYSAMMLDLNDFKKINDTYGHSVGDDALIEASQIMRDAVGRTGTVVRYAGDEFIVLLNTIDDKMIEKKVQAIRDSIDKFNEKNEKVYKLSVSIGHAKFDLKHQTIYDLMNVIDKRMYEDKRAYYAKNDRRKR